MKQTIAPAQEGPLLAHAMSKLIPGIFLHPVWVRFGKKETPIPPENLKALLQEAEQLQHDNPGDACQVLLICAVQLNNSGQASQALIMLQKALDLARSSRLTDAIPWAMWGECAICVQLGNYELADIHFRHLQTALHDQNDWMLADYIDVIRQFFSGPGGIGIENLPDLMKNKELKPLLTSTFDWLSHWGFPVQTANSHSQTLIDPSLPSPQGPWHTLKLIFSGELKFHWQSDFLHPKNHSPLWGSLLSLLRLNFVGQNTDIPTIDAIYAPYVFFAPTGGKRSRQGC